jgi:hypothetical protein
MYTDALGRRNYIYLQPEGGKVSFDGRSLPRMERDILKKLPYYRQWMDVWYAKSIMTYGPVPVVEFVQSNIVTIANGLRDLYGDCTSWWHKLEAMLPPSGQVKNFLNAALVAHQVPNGGRLAIVGSRYAQGSGDWVKLLAHWLAASNRSMVIHCYDPNETSEELSVGSVYVRSFPKAVDVTTLTGYDGLVDDIYVSSFGYERKDTTVRFSSHKMYEPAIVKGRFWPLFLHATESRYFSFDPEWEEVNSSCCCQRCKIEAYLNISRFSDVLSPSPCRRHIPEKIALSAQWNRLQVGDISEDLTPVAERAAIVVRKLEKQLASKDRIEVSRIVGYAPSEVPFFVGRPISRHATRPTVVARPGTLVAQAAILVTKKRQPGWECVDVLGEADDRWYYQKRPVQRSLLLPGGCDVYWNGVCVEKNRKIEIKRSGQSINIVGRHEVAQWCFLHRKQDDCGLRTMHLGYDQCSCGHRHGGWDLSPFGVNCQVGTKVIRDYSDFAKFTRYVSSTPTNLLIRQLYDSYSIEGRAIPLQSLSDALSLQDPMWRDKVPHEWCVGEYEGVGFCFRPMRLPNLPLQEWLDATGVPMESFWLYIKEPSCPYRYVSRKVRYVGD